MKKRVFALISLFILGFPLLVQGSIGAKLDGKLKALADWRLATQMELGYFETRDTVLRTYGLKVNGVGIKKEASFETAYKESNEGKRFTVQVGGKQELSKETGLLFIGKFTDDNILGINNRIDLGLGLEQLLSSDLASSHKLSCTALLINSKVATSLGYNYRYRSRFYNVEAVVSYIMPLSEVSLNADLSLKLAKFISIKFRNEYYSNKVSSDWMNSILLSLNI